MMLVKYIFLLVVWLVDYLATAHAYIKYVATRNHAFAGFRPDEPSSTPSAPAVS